MSSYRQLLYHLVFRTKDSLPTIKQDHVNQLYAYITGVVKHKNSHLYRINGIENHLHILTDIHPSLAPADFMKEVKVSSSLWMKSSNLFPAFNGWAVGYGSFTCSYKDMDRLIDYIKNQQEHHRKITFEEEYRILLKKYGIIPDESCFSVTLIFSSFRAAKDVVDFHPRLHRGLFIYGSFRAIDHFYFS
jgi:Transposase and inactivated derivatives